MGKSRLKGGCSQDWLPHMVSSYLPDATLARRQWAEPQQVHASHPSRRPSYAAAECSLGFMYYHGYGVQQDFAEAVRWYRKAAEQGYVIAQYYLGFRYYNGQGVPRDYVQAHMWMSLAASRATGEQKADAVSGLDLIARNMTPEQIAEAKRLSGERKPRLKPLVAIRRALLMARKTGPAETRAAVNHWSTASLTRPGLARFERDHPCR